MTDPPRLHFVPSRLTLGTVQLGLPYGVANKSGQPNEPEAKAILDAAVAAGITTFDTARAYGTSEERIGRWRTARDATGVRVVTKMPKITAVSEDQVADLVEDSIERSRVALGMDQLDLILAHNAHDLLRPGVMGALSKAQQSGHVHAIGASCYDPMEALLILERLPVAALQIPMNVCDRRFADAGILGLAASHRITVFIRSVFLQGALLLHPDDLPDHLRPLAEPLARLDALAGELATSRSELVLCAVRDSAAQASLVLGIERHDQLAGHLTAGRAPTLPIEAREEAYACFAGLPASVADPRRWSQLKPRQNT